MIEIKGRKIETRPDEVIIQAGDESYAFPRQVSALVTQAEITPEEYALVQEGDGASSAISMIQRFNGKKHLDTNIEVLKFGLAVPRTSRLVRQIINVNQALNGKGVLYDASGKLIEGDRLEKYADGLNHGCWVWNNESFEDGEGFLDLSVVYITGLNNGKPVFERQPLQKCLEKDCYADLKSVNEQGFPTEESPVQQCEPGKSVYFYYPRAGRAVRFDADPGDAFLYCYWNPLVTGAWLGVFACAEGASAKKSKK